MTTSLDRTFRSLFTHGERIEIPILQRDYAQGRTDPVTTELRKTFVRDLARTLEADDARLDLDFVYGRHSGGILQPLDGQQRLTTLFLLHWYLANRDDRWDDFTQWAVDPKSGSSRFGYQTRPSARNFFDLLVRTPLPMRELDDRDKPLERWFENLPRFQRHWLRDPTVHGCLVMLDALHQSLHESSGLYSKLVAEDRTPIVFRLLHLEDFGYSDELYVKMNARGKPLTPFEVFKAQLEQFVKSEFGDAPCPHATPSTWRSATLPTWHGYVSARFDGAWTDFMWRHPYEGSDLDAQLMHLIRAVAVISRVDAEPEDLEDRVLYLLEIPQPTCAEYVEQGCLDRQFVEKLVRLFDVLCETDGGRRLLERADYYDERDGLKRILLARGANEADGLRLHDWAKFYAWCALLLSSPPGASRTTFHEWMRIAANLVENTEIDRPERLAAALQGLRSLAQRCTDPNLLDQVAESTDDLTGLDRQQQLEERIKARLLRKDAAWRAPIEEAETHPGFRGDIGFLLRFSGIWERVAEDADWTDEEDASLRASFAAWHERACAVFQRSENLQPIVFSGALWQRALLATGDYLLRAGSNMSLLGGNGEATWKRLLRADTKLWDRDERRDVVRRVLEVLDPKNVVGSLEAIVAAGVQGDDSSPVAGWRARLVNDPRLLPYSKKGMIRFEEGRAYLLGSVRRSGQHWEIDTLDRCFKLRDRLPELAPFDEVEHISLSESGNVPTVVLRASELDLEIQAVIVDGQATLEVPRLDPPLALTLARPWSADENGWRCTIPDGELEATLEGLAQGLRALAPANA